MVFFQFLCFVSSILIHCGLTNAQSQPIYAYHFCEGANYTNNSQFPVNVNLLLSSLSSNATPGIGFFNTTIGQNPPDDDKAYGLFLCRGDVSAIVCKNCVETASKNITQRCPTQKESMIWYDECMLRYSNRSIFSTMQLSPTVYGANENSIFSNPIQFNMSLNKLMDELVRRVADNGSSTLKFAIGQANLEELYGMVQCTPDLSQFDCNTCLRAAVAQIPDCCSARRGGRIIKPSCFLRFETDLFYDDPKASPPLTQPGNTKGSGKNSSTIIVAIVVPSFIGLVLISIIIIRFSSQRRRTKKKFDNGEEITNVESLQFDFDTIKAATDNFSDANKLGKGGFGAVYKGRLSYGQEIAVKRLSRNSGQGEEQFKNEVLLVAKLQHRNLVKLLGFCIEGEERLLIYEFVLNASLNQFIFDPIKRASLNWEMRYKIIGGIARGLLYLHEDSRHRIVHRDLKASNILLDAEMNPKIADFGMARLCVRDQNYDNTDRIVGTYGYMSPEYAMHGQFSVKSDVYSFGVLILEMVTGQRNNNFEESELYENLLSYAWIHWKEGTALELIDPTLRSSFSTSEMMKCIHIGLLCVQENVADRPTMATVVLMLGSYSGTLSLPLPPAFSTHGRMKSNMHMSDSTLLSTVNEVTNTEIYPR